MPRCYPLRGYRRLYRSMMHYLDMSKMEARWLTYMLNTANLDTCRAHRPGIKFAEMNLSEFLNAMEYRAAPYFTPVQLYKSMEALIFNINPKAITEEQRVAVKRVRYHMARLEERFRMEYGVEIDEPVTSYDQCKWHLDPPWWAEPLSSFPIN